MVIDWTRTYKKYRGLWVALLDDEKTVIASGKTVNAVMAASIKRGYKQPILMRLPTEIIPYVG